MPHNIRIVSTYWPRRCGIGTFSRDLANALEHFTGEVGNVRVAAGNFFGISIAEKLSLGVALIRVITQKDALPLVEQLKDTNYGVTSVDGHGATGQVKVVFTIVPRREVPSVTALIKRFNPHAFYSIEEVGFVEKGTFPLRQSWRDSRLLRMFKPFRKGK